MANYNDTIEYFKSLATLHPKILHNETAEKKKFFRLNIEEFLGGSVRELPDSSSGAFLVLINYIKSYETEKGITNSSQQIMFYILKGYKHKDYNQEDLARIDTETIVEDFISVMREDSRNGNPFFRYSFDQLNNVRVIPAEIKTATGLYVGWQVNLILKRPDNNCFNSLNWVL